MKPTNDRAVQRVLVVIGIAATIFGGALLVSRLPFSREPSGIPSTTATIVSGEVKRPVLLAEGNRVANAELTLRGVAAKLNSVQSTKASLDLLLELRVTLGSLPAAAASELAQRFLATGTDARTLLPFSLGPGGSLQDAPSLRLFLLDYLEQIDPAAAVQVGLEILKRMDSADEWALALRSVAKFDRSAGSRVLLQEKLRQLFSHESWQQDPSVGYLESFDVAVHLGGNNLLQDLTRLLRMTNNQAVAHAAFLATDRLVQSDPTPVLATLLSEIGLMEGREATRANYFARADVSNSAQRQFVQDYLLNPKVTPSELDAFADVFPNENSMISNNLLTKTAPRNGTQIQARDIQTLQTINLWLQDPRFKNVVPQLNTIRSRLESFLRKPPPP